MNQATYAAIEERIASAQNPHLEAQQCSAPRLNWAASEDGLASEAPRG